VEEDDAEDRLLRALADAPAASVVPTIDVDGLHVDGADLSAAAPESIGGFRVVRTLGVGGMGVVYEAIDPVLDRRVAIKLLRGRRGDESARLLREAQALARLAHPNVVTIFQVGLDGDRVFLVMELVAGVTARRWVAAGDRAVGEIVDVYAQAARGLDAAHAAGLVHRDIKPDNILVGDDGRVRVTDFGLVRASAQTDRGNLTATGAVLGTLPYIAPEVHRGGVVGPAADQFALCVALWEALAGARPHAGNAEELIAAVCDGRLGASAGKLSEPLRDVLARGLAVDPEARWPSLAALFEALRTARPPHTRRVGIAVGAIGAIAIAAGVGLTRSKAPSRAWHGVPRVLATPQACPYMPAFVDDKTLAYTYEGGLYALPLDGPARRVPSPYSAFRANRGRHPGEAVFVGITDKGGAAFAELATGAGSREAIESSSFAFGGGALFYVRLDVPEIRRVLAGADAPVTKLPGGRWAYTVATTTRGDRLAITTAYDRSTPTICIVELDRETRLGTAPPLCLDRSDIALGRAAFSPDGRTLYYQTIGGIRRRSGDTDELWLPGVRADGGLDVSPDGTTLVFDDVRGRETRITELGAPAPVARGLIGGAVPLPDGGWLYVVAGDRDDQLIAQAPDGSTRVIVPSGLGRIAQPMVDRAGARAVIDVDAGAASGIYVVDLTPFPPVRLTTTAADSNPIFTADGKVAFTRWDVHDQPGVIVVDPGEGVRGDAARAPLHPLPRVTAGALGTTGELALLALDGKAIYAWNPATDRERALDVRGLGGRVVWQAMPSPDGTQLALLASDWTVWTLTLDGAATLVQPRAACTTGGPPVFDARGRLFTVTRPEAGAIYAVTLPPARGSSP